MKKINAELSIAKSINGKTIKKINTGKQNFLNMLLFINPYIFCYTMMALCKMRNSMSKFLQANMFKFNFFIDRPDLYLNSHKNLSILNQNQYFFYLSFYHKQYKALINL